MYVREGGSLDEFRNKKVKNLRYQGAVMAGFPEKMLSELSLPEFG